MLFTIWGRLDGRLHDNALSPLHQSVVQKKHNGGEDKDKHNDRGDHNRNIGVVKVVHFHGEIHRHFEDASILVDLVVDTSIGLTGADMLKLAVVLYPLICDSCRSPSPVYSTLLPFTLYVNVPLQVLSMTTVMA